MSHAQSAVTGTLALSSQLVDRGQAITPNTPILQGAASWTFAPGWTLGASAGVEARSPGQLVEALAQASRYWSLSPDWQMQANLIYYHYPSAEQRQAFSRAEAGLGWSYRDVLTLGLSAIYPVDGQDHRLRGAIDLGFHWPLPWRLSLSAGVGVAQPSPMTYGATNATSYEIGKGYDGSGYAYYYAQPSTKPYRYGHAGLAWSQGPWRVELDRIVTDGLPQPPGSLETAPWLGTISWAF
ncbi:hypothetical protein [Dyella solisilvae]|uniref:hypothetical protein n=1 Tax=Dyella solisilvae TaxID=1920168 RepID=UPI0011C070F3|nr:hypothetical protein [Dyella solisilvae]